MLVFGGQSPMGFCLVVATCMEMGPKGFFSVM